MARFQVTQIFSFPVQMEQSSPAQRKIWENAKGLWVFCPPVFVAAPAEKQAGGATGRTGPFLRYCKSF